MNKADRDSFYLAELGKSTSFLLEVLADILAAAGAPFRPAWEDLRKLIESSKLVDPAEIKRHAFNLAEELDEIKSRLARGQVEVKTTVASVPEAQGASGALTRVLLPHLFAVASLRPDCYLEEIKAMEERLRGGQDLPGFFQDLTNFLFLVREDVWEEKIRTVEQIGSIMKKLEAAEKCFHDSMVDSQDHLAKTEQGFTRAMASGLEEIGSLIEPQSTNLEELCRRLSEKVNQLCYQVELKKKADQARFEALEQAHQVTSRNLEKTKRDYDAFTTQSHERLQEIETLRSISLRDALTGIYNRRAYDRQMAATISAVKTGELKTAALAVFDIDLFREFNNSYGHLAGDRVLTHVTRMVAETLRGDDLFFRYGGDEYVIIMPNTTLQAAVKVGDKVRRTLEEVEFKIFKSSDQVVRVTVSVGVAEMEKSDDSRCFFARADKALYRAKQGGRNRVAT